MDACIEFILVPHTRDEWWEHYKEFRETLPPDRKLEAAGTREYFDRNFDVSVGEGGYLVVEGEDGVTRYQYVPTPREIMMALRMELGWW